jgi:hypothetical protein
VLLNVLDALLHNRAVLSLQAGRQSGAARAAQKRGDERQEVGQVQRGSRGASGRGRQAGKRGRQRGSSRRRTHLGEVLLGAHRLATLGGHGGGIGGGGGL